MIRRVEAGGMSKPIKVGDLIEIGRCHPHGPAIVEVLSIDRLAVLDSMALRCRLANEEYGDEFYVINQSDIIRGAQ